MSSKNPSIKVAVVQEASKIMDKAGCIDKLRKLTKKAAMNGAKLILFPEAFIPAYPRGLTFGTVVGSRSDAGKRDYALYWENSISIHSDDFKQICEVAKENKIYLIVGIIEKDGKKNGGTLYCTMVYVGPDGEYLGKHRKLKPTGSERLIWGEGDGSTLTAIKTPFGIIGGLICWENYMPLARTAIYSEGVDIYLAPTADAREQWQATIKHIALEGRCFVLACNQYVTKKMYPKTLACYDDLEEAPEVMSNGGSAIIDPNGNYLAGPLFGKNGILYADLDLNTITKSRFDFDVTGHYSRPDIFQLKIDKTERK